MLRRVNKKWPAALRVKTTRDVWLAHWLRRNRLATVERQWVMKHRAWESLVLITPEGRLAAAKKNARVMLSWDE
jgi:hypothetical protein